ncbi:MAG: ATP-dependent DNA ligase [Solirubrobacteraceae bacterium]|jgi:ATP-dependent DNA ligase
MAVEFGTPPALARSAATLPDGPEWVYEQKYDGFRAIVYVTPGGARIQSRGGKDLLRYFPELTFPVGEYVVDGEIVIDDPAGGEAFGLLQQRIHPAASRIARLAIESPASFIAFDLLALDGISLLERPFAQRRTALESIDGLRRAELVHDPADAQHWLQTAEGVVAKRLDAPYTPGKRTAMVKVKRQRTLDCVVVGYRPGKEPQSVGSLILGLYAEDGALRPVGHCSGFGAGERRELRARLTAFETGARGSGEPSRWSADRDLEWVELRPELVVEVSYDHVSDGRIRHGTKLLRWREDKPAQDCRLADLA